MADIKTNSFYMLFGQIVGKAGFFASLMIYSRVLDDGCFGELLFAVSVGLIVSFLSDMGVTLLVTRRLASGGSLNRILSSGIYLRAVLSLLSVSILISAGWIAGYSQSQLLLILFVSLGFVLDGFCETAFAVFRAGEVMKNESIARILHGTGAILLALYAMHAGKGIYFIGITYIVRQLPAVAFVYLRIYRMGFRIDTETVQPVVSNSVSLLKAALPLGLVGILIAAGFRVDSVFIKANLGDAAVAAYQQSLKIFETMVLIVSPTLLPGALFASLCEAARIGWSTVRSKIEWITELFAVIAAVLVIPLWASELHLLRLVWGMDFLRGLQADVVLQTFRVVVLTLPSVFFFHLYMSVFIAEERQKQALPLVAVSLLFQIVLLSVLVPLLGISGAAVAYSGLFSLLSFLFAMKLHRIHGRTGFLAGVKRPAAAFVPAFIIVVLMPFSPVVSASISMIVFFSIWLSTGGGKILQDFRRTSAREKRDTFFL